MPAQVRVKLRAQLAPYRKQHPNVRWTSPESWHLTLVFLGSVEASRVAELERLLDEVALATAPFDVLVDRGGGRPRHDGGVAWLGLSTGASTLIEAATLAAEGCPPDIVGGSPPKRTPSAHLTVVRKADEPVIESLRSQACGPLGVSWTVDAVALVRSHLEPAGARYVTLHQATL